MSAESEFLAKAADMFAPPPPPRWPTPGALAAEQNPATVRTPALDLIDAALVEAYNTPDSRLIINMPPQEGKTTRVTQDFPLWVLTQNQDARIIVASNLTGLAMENGRQIRNRIARGDLGLSIARDNGSAQIWSLAGRRGGVLSAGVATGIAGRPADLLLIDDPIKSREQADSPTYREKVWNWWTADAAARLAPGAPVIVVMTRWHDDDLAGRLVERNPEAGWKVLNIPAQADHDPNKGETDPLGREPGEYMLSARGRTRNQWELRKAAAGTRDWNAQYQGRPSAQEGGEFKRAWWRYWTTPLYTEAPDGSCTVPPGVTALMSWDMTFKDTDQSDYVVGQVWAKKGQDAYLLDQYRERATFTETLAAVQRMKAKWPGVHLVLIEDKANGTAVLDSLRKVMPGLVAVTPHESKTARASAITPFVEAGNVHLPINKPFTADLVEEAAAFPTGSHDDQVDAMTQAMNRFYLTGGQAQSWLTWMEQQIEQRDGGVAGV